MLETLGGGLVGLIFVVVLGADDDGPERAGGTPAGTFSAGTPSVSILSRLLDAERTSVVLSLRIFR